MFIKKLLDRIHNKIYGFLFLIYKKFYKAQILKNIDLPLLEVLNFMHLNAKCVHGSLAPENIFITKQGKLKLGGLNFCS